MSDSARIGHEVGSPAPDRAGSGLERRAGEGEPRVLAFVQGGLDREAPDAIDAIRAELRGLGAELVIVSPAGVWAVRADDPVEPLAGPGDGLAAAVRRYGVPAGEEAVLVIDGRGVMRFSCRLPLDGEAAYTRLANALAIAGRAVHARDDHEVRPRAMFTRREWAVTCLVAGCAAAFLGCKEQSHPPADHRPPAGEAPAEVDVTLTINGARHPLRLDPRTSLLDALRERLGLTGSKKGCDMGQCGACTVLVGGKRVISCLTLAVMAQGKDITTIEGLARGGALHPVQAAFIAHDGLQCGYCTPGQILSAVGLLGEARATTDETTDEMTDDEIREQMSGNLCRCGAYPNIVAAIQSVRRARG